MDVIVGTRTEGPWTVVEVAGELDLHTRRHSASICSS